MRKRLKILLIFILTILPLNVYADSGSTNLKCSKTNVVPGEEITCTLTGSVTDGVVSAISSKITTSSNLTLGAVTVDSSWQGTGEAKLDLYTDSNKSGNFGIATFKVKVAGNISGSASGTITVGTTKFYDGSYKEYTVR